MSGISRATALMIQGNEVECDAEMIDGKWSGIIRMLKGRYGVPHCLLISTTPIFPDSRAAMDHMAALVAEIRSMDVLK